MIEEEISCRRGACDRDRFRDGQCEMHYYKEKHCQRVLEEYPEPLNYLVCELVEKNCEKFLTGYRKRTHGAEQVREDGLTENHRRWIATLQEESDGESFIDRRLDETDAVPEDELSDDFTFGYHRGYRAALKRVKSELFGREEDDSSG